MKEKISDKEFKSFQRELYELMNKYNVDVKKGSEEIVFGLDGSIITHNSGLSHVEREVVIAFTEMLTRDKAKEEKENRLLIF